ncbi:hypothetical protein OB2597_05455 [Pseudooceanicola batsensis HTCC2597]|uniref:2,4-dihydroxyhept-2-ene-1,7-dioic acid aldolase n=2 Tax=Pseudooceanicola batsensis TaxID=314255 RepID=A3TSS6_PSEBH|nr:DUF2218 domain-containing protein [Pseudooceanicola batsensis]EAQ04703.1 hypothetical protein OB2597_05455 [Pseudooceanicola batsensis HTCC2597]
MTMTQTGTFRTPNASRYLQQLCKHFEHKIAVDYDDRKGKAALPSGEATLAASDEALTVTVSAEDDPGLERARFIVDDHLKRFAFREDCQGMDWRAD